LVVDTAFLFALEGDAKGLPSLKDLAKQLLDIDMTKIHDSAVDAAVTAKVANHELMHGPSPPIKKSDKNAGQLSQLRVHRLPLSIAVSDIESFFMQRTKIKPESVENIVPSKSGTHARTTLLFTSPAHANLAFDTLAGTAINDTVGRPEKKIKFTASGVDHGSIHVGKFTAKPKRRRSEGAKVTLPPPLPPPPPPPLPLPPSFVLCPLSINPSAYCSFIRSLPTLLSCPLPFSALLSLLHFPLRNGH
jgi:RNA exonuclease 1